MFEDMRRGKKKNRHLISILIVRNGKGDSGGEHTQAENDILEFGGRRKERERERERDERVNMREGGEAGEREKREPFKSLLFCE